MRISRYRRPSEPMVCMGENTTSGSKRLTASAVSTSAGEVTEGPVIVATSSGTNARWAGSLTSAHSRTRGSCRTSRAVAASSCAL